MSVFSDIVNDVYTITNRPDLIAETALAVRQETIAAHRSGVFWKDMQELLITFTSGSVFQMDIPSLFPSWRSFAYVRPYDTVSQSPAGFILGPKDFLKPDAIFDEWGIERVNVAYVAGTNLNVKLQAAFTGLLVGYYKNPIVSPDSAYVSWILTEQPALIVIGAAERILTMVGFEEAAARLRIMLYGAGAGSSRAHPTGGEYQLLAQSNLEEFGR